MRQLVHWIKLAWIQGTNEDGCREQHESAAHCSLLDANKLRESIVGDDRGAHHDDVGLRIR